MDDGGPFDDMASRDAEDRMPSMTDKEFKDRERKRTPPNKNSNIKKARRLRNIINTLKRERSSAEQADDDVSIDNGETPAAPSLGGHGSNFLFR